jgi:cytochrome bd-type quinol oxidase subunit 2
VTDLAIIWAAILAFAIYAYVVLDGFDLGVGAIQFRQPALAPMRTSGAPSRAASAV